MVRGRSILRNDYVLPGAYDVPPQVGAGGYMLILDAGAYCATQHMEFLNVPPAAEVLVDRHGEPKLITQRGERHGQVAPSHRRSGFHSDPSPRVRTPGEEP